MHSDSLHEARLDAPGDGRVVARLLEPVFGFFVWAGHLVVIYTANAVACGLGLTSRIPAGETVLIVALAAITVVAAIVVGMHGLKRYRQPPETPNEAFLLRLAVGQDAIALLAILWQLVPIFMSPVCR